MSFTSTVQDIPYIPFRKTLTERNNKEGWLSNLAQNSHTHVSDSYPVSPVQPVQYIEPQQYEDAYERTFGSNPEDYDYSINMKGIRDGATPHTRNAYDTAKPGFSKSVNGDLYAMGMHHGSQFGETTYTERPHIESSFKGIRDGATPHTRNAYDTAKPGFGETTYEGDDNWRFQNNIAEDGAYKTAMPGFDGTGFDAVGQDLDYYV